MARNKYDVDEVLEDKFDINQLKRLLAYLIPYRKRFVSVGFMMLSASAAKTIDGRRVTIISTAISTARILFFLMCHPPFIYH